MYSNRIDWTKKGLGWIPDLPVAVSVEQGRSQISGNLQRDEATEYFAQLTAQLLNLVEVVKSLGQAEQLKSIQQKLSELDKKVTRNITFPEVDFYRVLKRSLSDQPGVKNSSEDVIRLKAALATFYMKQPCENEARKTFIKNAKLKDLTIDPILVGWLSEGEFDDGLEKIIKTFQNDNNLLDDGIVGLKTYRKIEEKLNLRSNDLSVELLPIPPIIPSDILEIVFDCLKLTWLKEKLKKHMNYQREEREEREDNSISLESTEIIDQFFEVKAKRILDCLSKKEDAKVLILDARSAERYEPIPVNYGPPNNIYSCLEEIFSDIQQGEAFEEIFSDVQQGKAYRLELMRLDEAQEIPQEGRNLVIVAKIDGFYHIRIFDTTGSIVLGDKDKPISLEFNNSSDLLFETLETKLNSQNAQNLDDGEENELIQKIVLNVYHSLKHKNYFGQLGEDLNELFCRNFHVIEPLIAAIYQVASPFSGYANPIQAIRSSFNKLEGYLNSQFQQNSATYKPFAGLFRLYSGQDILSNYADSTREYLLIRDLVSAVLIKMRRERMTALCYRDYETQREQESLEIVPSLRDNLGLKNLIKSSIWKSLLNSNSEEITKKIEQIKEFEVVADKLHELKFTAFADDIHELIELSNNVKQAGKNDYTELIILAKKIEARKNSVLFFEFLEEILGQDDQLFTSQDARESKYYSMLYNKQELFGISFSPSNFKQIERQCPDTENKSLFPPTIPIQLPINTAQIQSRFELEADKQCFFFLPNVVDLSLWCSPVKDQGSLNTCTVLSGIALVEYWFRQKFGKHEDLSALFLYKAARDLMQVSGDTGTSVQATMQAMVLFGIPPEEYWPYQEEYFDKEPPAFCFSYAQSYQALQYFRLDSADVLFDRQLLLLKIRATLAAGIPCMFGLTLYSSVYNESNINQGYIPYPSDRDKIVGGHTLVAVGYNDYKSINQANGLPSIPGALLVRNSWGSEWGKEGYGWLSYEYVLNGLTADWWSLIKVEWFDRQTLGLGVRGAGGDPIYPRSV